MLILWLPYPTCPRISVSSALPSLPQTREQGPVQSQRLRGSQPLSLHESQLRELMVLCYT